CERNWLRFNRASRPVAVNIDSDRVRKASSNCRVCHRSSELHLERCADLCSLVTRQCSDRHNLLCGSNSCCGPEYRGIATRNSCYSISTIGDSSASGIDILVPESALVA